MVIQHIFRKRLFINLWLTLSCLQLFCQETSVEKFVNPFIGTTKTKLFTQWGGDGGTYPGAVAPFGFVQLTPETRVKNTNGYDYRDSTIFWFSCVNHLSGYPEGSSGKIKIMPVEECQNFQVGEYNRLFSHECEKAEAGYYRVIFNENGTTVEATASQRTGMFRFTFPPKIKPKIFIGDIGKIEVQSNRILEGSAFNTILSFSIDFINKEDIKGGCVLTFPSVDHGNNVVILKLGVSMIDFESTRINLKTENDTFDFDRFKDSNQQKWNKALSVIEIDDTSKVNKTIFYTALYHSMLLPWVISDVKGKFKGNDGLFCMTKGQNKYGSFSPWDTFRSLHPLLCLIAPDRQNDMILSMLDQYEQSGKLAKGPMTGNHIIAIIVDSYLKGIRDYDSTLAYKAMKTCLNPSSDKSDFFAYKSSGYVPSSYSESVTKTVEYAYNDWVLAQFAGKVMNDTAEYRQLLERSFNYRNLFRPEVLALLPRNGNTFNLDPGNSGYKEGDKWSYSLFVLHNPRDLINLMGGDNEFSANLDSSLENGHIVFDNEPVLHVPYLFNYAGSSYNSQKWVRRIMKTHYTASADGLPGNDDLGSMSSWYVFSAMGFFPVCPGKPVYDFGSPIFKKVTLNLNNGKKLVINSVNNSDNNNFVKTVSFNGLEYQKSWISHSELIQGGELTFIMDNIPTSVLSNAFDFVASSETNKSTDFLISDFYLSKKQVRPDQPFFIKFKVQNKGSKGTKIVKLYTDGKVYRSKNILVDENSIVSDSIECRLYPYGNRTIRIDDLKEKKIEVIPPLFKQLSYIEVVDLKSKTITKKGVPLNFNYQIRNIGGYRDTATISVFADDTIYQNQLFKLEPGETKKIFSQLIFKSDGIHKLNVGSISKKITSYSNSQDSELVGFNNNENTDNLETKITVMTWVKATGQSRELMDIITKGDFIVLQANGNRTLSFFAGGWGRGVCTVPLPKNWLDNWHHIAGVSDGYILKIFIDGIESGSLVINEPVSLASSAKWMIGRNEEFPDQRFFKGLIDHFKIFTEPLTGAEIISEMQKQNFINN